MKIGSISPGRRGNASPGFAITDAVVAMLLLTVAVGGLAGSVTYGLRLHRTNRESAVAEQAARAILAELRSVPFSDVFAEYSADPDIAVGGLNARPDDPDGMVGKLVFPTTDAAGPLQLREDADMPALGCPRDLDGDDDLDSVGTTDNYIILPVTLRLEWRGAGGDATQVYHTVLTQ
jgi:hypothetical protein